MTRARYSLSEIEAVGLKAARGAGMDWGLAEEAGFAARKLAEMGLAGPEMLLACLNAPRGAMPMAQPIEWRGNGGQPLCPIATGATLSDHARLPQGQMAAGLRIAGLHYPALLLPFIQVIAADLGEVYQIAWPGMDALIGGTGFVLRGNAVALHLADEVTITRSDATVATVPRQTGRDVARDVWQGLNALALQTTVPASAESRANAGAGQSDND